uniref:Uncharacterized protein n=1 Tax=viral metagenome TaxID=1070528 RepID=A0A2V0RI44_9ZZZZ
MEQAASVYGDVFKTENFCDPWPDQSLWNFTIAELSRYKYMEKFIERLNDLSVNRCVYATLCTVYSYADDVREVFCCPCGVNRGLIICIGDAVDYADVIASHVARLLRSLIKRRGGGQTDAPICAYCLKGLNLNVAVTERIEAVQQHVAKELRKDDGVRLCYCDTPSICKCYLEQSVGFGTCVPMILSTPGEHSVWCNSCEYPRFCTNPRSLEVDHIDTVKTSQNAGTDPVPFKYEADVVPLQLMPTMNKLLSECLSLAGHRKTIYLQGSGCEHSRIAQCACPEEDVMTNCIYVNMCVTYSMAMQLRDALHNRGITLVVECISCGKTQLCPEVEVNALEAYDDVCVDVAEYSVKVQNSERVSHEFIGYE